MSERGQNFDVLKKLLKLKDKLATAKEGKEKDGILTKIHVVSPWWKVASGQQPDNSQSALALMKQLAEQLALTDFSRGAIYRAQLWFEGLSEHPLDGLLADLPAEKRKQFLADLENKKLDAIEREKAISKLWRDQMASSLAYQFNRQKGDAAVARRVVDFVCDVMKPPHPKTAIANFLVTSEFFARETRSFRSDKPAQRSPETAGVSA